MYLLKTRKLLGTVTNYFTSRFLDWLKRCWPGTGRTHNGIAVPHKEVAYWGVSQVFLSIFFYSRAAYFPSIWKAKAEISLQGYWTPVASSIFKNFVVDISVLTSGNYKNTIPIKCIHIAHTYRCTCTHAHTHTNTFTQACTHIYVRCFQRLVTQDPFALRSCFFLLSTTRKFD